MEFTPTLSRSKITVGNLILRWSSLPPEVVRRLQSVISFFGGVHSRPKSSKITVGNLILRWSSLPPEVDRRLQSVISFFGGAHSHAKSTYGKYFFEITSTEDPNTGHYFFERPGCRALLFRKTRTPGTTFFRRPEHRALLLSKTRYRAFFYRRPETPGTLSIKDPIPGILSTYRRPEHRALFYQRPDNRALVLSKTRVPGIISTKDPYIRAFDLSPPSHKSSEDPIPGTSLKSSGLDPALAKSSGLDPALVLKSYGT